MADLRWTLAAAEDLRLLEEWIARDSPLNAVEFTDRLVQATERLVDAPRLGRQVPEFDREEIREIIFRAYRIVYLLSKTHITVLRVVHGARDLNQISSGEPWIQE